MILLEGQKDVYMPVKLISELSGEAKIYLCENQKTEFFVAKISDGLAGTSQQVRQFLYHTESPYIMKLMDFGIVDFHEKKCVFELYEYMQEGTWDLKAPLAPEYVERILIPSMNEGLHAIHEAGVIHRDVKPDNLYVRTDDAGTAQIVYGDFGISVSMGEDGRYCDTALAYTPGYAPAEVLGGGMYSAASDYYGLGVSIYYLLTGKQIFEGLSPDEIMVKTRRGEIPPFEGLSVRLAALLEGLMVQDPRYRWGYQEVKQWIDGASVPVFRHTQANQILDPAYYLTANLPCHSLKELAQNIGSHPDEGIEHLYDGLLAEGLKKQYPYLFSGLNKLVTEEYPLKKLAGLTAAVKLIDTEYEGICWAGTHYDGLNQLLLMVRNNLALGKHMPEMSELLTSGLLSSYYSNDLLAEDVAVLKQIEHIAKEDHLTAVSLLVLRFLPEPIYQIGEDILIHNMSEYARYLAQNRTQVKSILAKDMNHPYFQNFVKSCGYETQFQSWHSYFYHNGKIDLDGHLVGNACQFFSEICPEQDQNLKVFVLDEIKSSPEYWMKDHLDLYEMDEMMDRMVRDNFDEVTLSDNMSVQTLLKEQHRLKESMHELRRDLLNNYALLEQGIYDTAGYRIIPLHGDGLFVEDRNGEMVPVGWLKESMGLSANAVIQDGYKRMREEASAYITQNVEKALKWSKECERACEEKRRERQRPGVIGGILGLAIATLAMFMLVSLSQRYLVDCGLITLVGFGAAFFATVLWLVAILHRFVKVVVWNRLVRSGKHLVEIGNQMNERKSHFSTDAVEEIKPCKNNLETEAQVERSFGSNLLSDYRLRNGLLRYGILFLLTCSVLGVGLMQDGTFRRSDTDLKSSILSLFDFNILFPGGNESEHAKTKNYVVAVNVARMRSGPSTDHEVLNVYEEGTVMIPTGKKEKEHEYIWYEVTGPDENTGWMRSDTIEKE